MRLSPDDQARMDGLWDRVNSLGGTPSDEYDRGRCDAIDDVLAILEAAGARSPYERRADALLSADRRAA